MQNGCFVKAPSSASLQAGLGDLLPANTSLRAYLGLSHRHGWSWTPLLPLKQHIWFEELIPVCLEVFGAVVLQSAHSPTDEPNINAINAAEAEGR